MNITGLSQAEVAARAAAGQSNTAIAKSSRSVSDILRANILTPFNALLLTLATVVTIIDQSILNSLFGVIMIVNSGIGIFQELKAKRMLDKLAILHAPHAHVVRDGREQEVAVSEVVLGDTVHLKLGDQIVADGKIIQSGDMEIDESLLTGESDPVVKKVGQAVLSGSIVVAGEGYAVVTAVGDEAYATKIAEAAKRFQRAHSELLTSTNLLLKWISWMLVVVAPLLIWGQLRIDGGEWRDAVIHATAAIVGMIPEGLVLLTSMAFMLATVTLVRRQVLVQQMPAVEGLARVDTLLLDKTGTLTEGNVRFEAMIEVGERGDAAAINRVLATLAGRTANPTNDAIQRALKNVKPLKFKSEVPFSSSRKWSAVTVADGAHWVFGAPEVLFARDADNPTYKQARKIAGEGKRVLVLMSSRTAARTDKLPSKLEPRALVILSEKVRSDAAKTLRYFAEQGVDIKVISGDSPLTVAAVARRVGLTVKRPFDARELPDDPAELSKIVLEYNVFGRVQPEQKRLITKILQSQGHVVAMTGDGVNDTLALKDADIGIAMNSGAPATKAVAELVLLDNKFSHLPKVLAEGRRVIANIERVANLFVIKNVYSLVLALAVTVAGLTYPYLPVQMSIISVLTIGLPAFCLALVPNSRRYQPGFLKRVLSFAVPVGIVGAAAMMVNYTLLGRLGLSQAAAGTSTSIVLMMVSMTALVCLARPLRGWKLGLVAGLAGVFVVALLAPPIAQLLEFVIDIGSLPLTLTVGAVGAGLVVLITKINQKTA
jgi:cation-transporting ATPase E